MPNECIICDGEKVFEGEQCKYCEATGFDLDHNDNPVCPHCGYEEEEHAELSLKDWSDGGESNEICSRCNKEYGLILSVTYSFSTTLGRN